MKNSKQPKSQRMNWQPIKSTTNIKIESIKSKVVNVSNNHNNKIIE